MSGHTPSAGAMRAAVRLMNDAWKVDAHPFQPSLEDAEVAAIIEAEFAPVVENLRDALRDAIAILDRRRRGFDPYVSVGDLTKQVVDRGDKALAALEGK